MSLKIQLIMQREIIAVCFEVLIKYVRILCGQNVEFFNRRSDGIWNSLRPETVQTQS